MKVLSAGRDLLGTSLPEWVGLVVWSVVSGVSFFF